MLALGVSTAFAAGRSPVITLAFVEGDLQDPKLVEACELRTAETSILDQIEDLARKLSSTLSGVSPDAVVIRVADTAPTGTRAAGPRYRLMIEGALAYVCRVQKIQDVQMRNGKEMGEALGTNKAGALARGKALDAKCFEAAAAAVTALPSQT
ncbi:hypothetical protein ACIHJG_21120 [Streptomyces sp. NPDC052415]|uniref:hypothetical protein n=1 Tax=Streptomyces sp. NPDC052415 TaxID=3365690 RepID=UPI0037D48D35